MAKTYSSIDREELRAAAIAAWQNVHDVYHARAMAACEDRDPFTVAQFMKVAMSADTRARQLSNGYLNK